MYNRVEGRFGFLADSPQAERVSEAKRLAGKRTRRRYRVADLSAEALEKELRRLERQQGRGHWLWGTLIAFVLALVVGALAASRFLMIATVHGNSMSPTLENGSVVVCLRGSETERGALARRDRPGSLRCWVTDSPGRFAALAGRFLTGPDTLEVRHTALNKEKTER